MSALVLTFKRDVRVLVLIGRSRLCLRDLAQLGKVGRIRFGQHAGVAEWQTLRT